MSQTVVAYRIDLLGGRLLNLMHGWRLARRLDADFIHLWPLFSKWRVQSGYADEAQPLSQIFNLADYALARPDMRFATIEGASVAEVMRLTQKRLRLLPHTPDDVAAYPFAPREADLLLHWPRAGFTASTPFPLAGEAPATVRSEATDLIRTLPLSATLAAALRRIRDAFDLSASVTVNLRRGDVLRSSALLADQTDDEVRQYASVFVSRYAPESAYVEALAAWPSHTALVFSDTPEAAAAFAARWPGGIDARALLAPIAAELTPLQAHMLQILAMSETQGVLGSGSNFPIAAAFYGGRPYRDVRDLWTAKAVSEVIDETFATYPRRVIAALLDAFDTYFAGQPHLAVERQALAEMRDARVA